MKIKLLIFIFFTTLLVSCSNKNIYIKRKDAFKAITLTMTTKKDLLEEENEFDLKNIPSKVYVNYLLENNIIDKKLSKKSLEGLLSLQDLYKIYRNMPQNEVVDNIYKKYSKKDKIKIDDFYKFIIYFNKTHLKSGKAKIVNTIIYDIEDNNKNQNKVKTKFQNYYSDKSRSLFKYIDKYSKLLILDDEIFYADIISNEIVYTNVMISTIKNNKVKAFIDGVERDFKLDKNINEYNDKKDILVDLNIRDGLIYKINIRGTKINDTILSIDKNLIELKNHGYLLFDKNMIILDKTNMQIINISKLIVGLAGYDIYIDKNNYIKFIIKPSEDDYKNVRVLILNDYFKVKHHNTISLYSKSGLKIIRKNTSFETRDIINFTKDNLEENERIIIKPVEYNKEIEVLSLKRDFGTPGYLGHLEIVRKDNKIYLINEIEIEEYLRKVVPSEMPKSFELEALKAQAVVARTYTCKAIENNRELNYLGANLDDSINYQVYANNAINQKADMAILATKGKKIYYNNILANTFYYSTSAGFSVSSSIWGQKNNSMPYLKSYTISKNKEKVNISTNSEFKKFIEKKDKNAYEKDYDFYRWELETSNRILNEKITKVGNVLDINITKRAQDGIVKEIEVIGENGKYKIIGEANIRFYLSSKYASLLKNNNKKIRAFNSLPSSLFYIEASKPDDNNLIKFKIKGGGYGHGVGMSQTAANEMAKDKMNYEEIIEFFYENTEIKLDRFAKN